MSQRQPPRNILRDLRNQLGECEVERDDCLQTFHEMVGHTRQVYSILRGVAPRSVFIAVDQAAVEQMRNFFEDQGIGTMVIPPTDGQFNYLLLITDDIPDIEEGGAA